MTSESVASSGPHADGHRLAPPEIDAVVVAVSPWADLLFSLFQLGAGRHLREPCELRELAALAGTSTNGLSRLRTALDSAVLAGAAQRKENDRWHLHLSPESYQHIALMLKGVALYRSRVHRDTDTVQIVLSKPPPPSAFAIALEQSLQGDWGLSLTSETLERMAHAARNRFLVMTPFLDSEGIRRLLALYELTQPCVLRVLIVRDMNAMELMPYAKQLKDLNVSIHEFRLQRGQGQHETFHAKVVLSDDEQCYVGSSNMTNWSFNYSLELGFLVQGASAHRMASILGAVLAVSSKAPKQGST